MNFRRSKSEAGMLSLYKSKNFRRVAAFIDLRPNIYGRSTFSNTSFLKTLPCMRNPVNMWHFSDWHIYSFKTQRNENSFKTNEIRVVLELKENPAALLYLSGMAAKCHRMSFTSPWCSTVKRAAQIPQEPKLIATWQERPGPPFSYWKTNADRSTSPSRHKSSTDASRHTGAEADD